MRPKILIVDVDGTVADKGDRHPFDWFKVDEDRPIELVCSNVRALQEYVDGIIFLSGRSEFCRWQTEQWLSEHVLPKPWSLYMRQADDYRPDTIIKDELYTIHIEPYYEVFLILDDRNSVVGMWREKGLPVYQVAFGDF